MTVDIIGANPGLSLLDEAGRLVAFASVWQVEWSIHGPGRALVLWQAGRPRLITDAPALGVWLADSFVRHFPELTGCSWSRPEPEPGPVDWHLDLATGFRAAAGDIEVAIGDPLDRRVARTDRFVLGDRTHGFSTVYVPCRHGELRLAGTVVRGSVRISGDPPSSGAFLAVAEVWTSGTNHS